MDRPELRPRSLDKIAHVLRSGQIPLDVSDIIWADPGTGQPLCRLCRLDDVVDRHPCAVIGQLFDYAQANRAATARNDDMLSTQRILTKSHSHISRSYRPRAVLDTILLARQQMNGSSIRPSSRKYALSK